jgi:hypothetical protein
MHGGSGDAQPQYRSEHPTFKAVLKRASDEAADERTDAMWRELDAIFEQ